MNTNYEYMPNDPRDQERQMTSTEQEQSEMDQHGADQNQEQIDEREAAPTDEDITDHSRSAQTEEGLIPVLKEKKVEPGDEDDDAEDQDEDLDEEEEEDEEDLDREEESSEKGRDTTMRNPGDDYPSPANNPYETNFEDPARNRKTDPMTDHEPRHQGI